LLLFPVTNSDRKYQASKMRFEQFWNYRESKRENRVLEGEFERWREKLEREMRGREN